MKNLLIVCDAFPPAFAPRMGSLCKYIREFGWRVYVLTEKQKSVGSISDCNADGYLELNYYNRDSQAYWLCKFALDYLLNKKSSEMVALFKRNWSEVKFDAVLCSAYLSFPMAAAFKISKICDAPLVYDFRDLIEQFVGFEFAKHKIFGWKLLNDALHKIRRKKIISERNRLMCKASAVTTVSPWHKGFIDAVLEHGDARCKSAEVIYNGYDPQYFAPKKIKSDRFIIEYTGRVLDIDLQNPLLLFEALKKMKCGGTISASDFVVRWNIDAKSAERVKALVEKYGVEEFNEICGYVPQIKVPELLNESSIILVLTNKMKKGGPHGILTTKLFEALSVRKPILCVRSDESYLEQLIFTSDAGIAATDREQVINFISKNYAAWKRDGIVGVDSKTEFIERFSRKYEAGQFDRLLKTL